MVSAALASSFAPLAIAAGTLGGVAVAWVVRLPALSIVVLLGSVLLGQVGRVPLPGQGGGLLVSDVALGLVLLAAWVVWLWRRPGDSLAGWWLLMVAPFIVWSLCGWALASVEYAGTAGLIAGAYWGRLTALLVLPAAVFVLVRAAHVQRPLRYGLSAGVVLFVGLGAMQLWWLPHLSVLGGGWDPHEGRLTATWLDPNFAGIVLGMGLLVAVALWLQVRWAGWLVFFTLVGLLATQSRSAWLAVAAGGLVLLSLLVVQVRQWWRVEQAGKLFVLIGSAVLGAVLGWLLLGERAIGLFTFDATVAVRLAALRAVWEMVADFGWLGVGYNFYQYAARAAGLIGDFTIHSRAGADTSWLTIWITTGLPGLLLFIFPWLTALSYLAWRWFKGRSFVAAGVLAALVALMIHALFVNSLLYAHLLIVAALLGGLAVTDPVTET